jgi:alkylhydroperoxidase/carboxymuconolactone decarboxylase family protein YurZ
MTELNARQQRLRDAFIELRGYWGPQHDTLVRLSADLFESHSHSASLPWVKGVIEPKVKEFIYIALDVNASHLYEPGLRLHLNNAVKFGATLDELAHVLIVVATVGLNTFEAGLPIVVEEAKAMGVAVPETDQPADSIGKRYEDNVGSLPAGLRLLAKIAPEYFEAAVDLSVAASTTGPLPEKVKAFLRLTADLTTTKIFGPAARLHVRDALRHGATVPELVEVLHLVSIVGLHSCTFGGPILFEEVKSGAKTTNTGSSTQAGGKRNVLGQASE